MHKLENRTSKFLVLTTMVALSFIADKAAISSPKTQEGSSSSKPLIGINTDVDGEKPVVYSTNKQYVDAIEKAGGIPVLLPPMPESSMAAIIKELDGILMIGGADYPPSIYGKEQDSSCSLMDPERSKFDLSLAKTALENKTLPLMGICAGCQALNIAAGGTLIQDIPKAKPESRIKHSSPSGWRVGFNRHEVVLKDDCKIASALGQTRVEVVTSHHQCVDHPGKDFQVTASSDDGVVEAIEKPGERFVIGVQWHPERDYETNEKLFKEFIRQAAVHRNKRLSMEAGQSSN